MKNPSIEEINRIRAMLYDLISFSVFEDMTIFSKQLNRLILVTSIYDIFSWDIIEKGLDPTILAQELFDTFKKCFPVD